MYTVDSTLVWVLSSLGSVAGVVLLVSVLVIAVAVGRRQVKKKRGLLTHHDPEDVFIEMDDISGFQQNSLDESDDELDLGDASVLLEEDSDSDMDM